MEQLINIILILLPLSFISERLSNIIKLLIPSSWFGNLKVREATEISEKKRELRILLVSIVSGELIAYGSGANLFSIVNGGSIGWGEYSSENWLLGCLLTGFFLSWGSKFWHDMLDLLLEVKNAKKTLNETQKTEGKLKKIQVATAIEKGGLEHQLARPEPESPVKKPTDVPEDKVTLQRLKLMHPDLRNELDDIYREVRSRGVAIRVTDTLRTFEEQDALYAKGRTMPGKIVTYAKGGQSYHNYGLALDFCLLLDGGREVSWDRTLDLDNDQLKDWDEVVAVFRHFNWDWGGDWTRFRDYPHFQKTFQQSTADLLALYNQNKKDKDNYVKLP